MKALLILLCAFLAVLRVHAIDPITGPSSVCTGATITLSSTTTGGTWSTAVGAPGTIDVSGVLTGIAAGVVTVTYTVGGPYITTDVTVNPTPALTSAITASICDNTLFAYTPTSSVPGTTFSWYRPAVPGIAALSGSGTGGISEVLDNTVSFPVSLTYVFTLAVGGCSSTQTVNVTVQPTPLLSGITAATTCSGSLFTYFATSVTLGTTFQWSRAPVVGIMPATATGTGNISETLVNSVTGPVTAVYIYTLTAAACTHTQSVNVVVNVSPDAGAISGVDTLCQGTNSTFSTTGTGGIWGNVTGKVSVSAGGVVTGVNPGADTVMYLVTNSCGTDLSRKPVWVRPAAECITGVHQVKKETAPVVVYPNPSQGVFYIEAAQHSTEDVAIMITDATGRCVQDFTVPVGSTRKIDLWPAPSGTYVIMATTATGVYHTKAIIVN